jgi:hypothetical protein
MEMYDSLFSSGCQLNEQLARQIFEILPEQGPIMVIIAKDGHCWPSDSDRFSNLNVSEQLLRDICEKIDDGSEPLISQADDFSIVAAQLATEQNNWGYVVIILPKYSPESTLANIDLIEILLSQIGLIAKLIEKNNHLYELQTKQFSLYSTGRVSSN